MGLSWLSSVDKSSDIDTAFRRTRYMHILFLASVALYDVAGMILKLLVMGSEPGFVGLPSAAYSILWVTLAIASVVIIVVVLHTIPKQMSPEELVKRESVSSSEELGRVLSVAHVIRVAPVQAIAIMGLSLFLLNGDLLPLFVFSGIAFVLLLLMIPHRIEWDEARLLIGNDVA